MRLPGEGPEAPEGLRAPPKRKDDKEDLGPVIAPEPFSESNPFDWRTKFRTDAVSHVEKWAEDFGVNKFALDAWVRDSMDSTLSYILHNVFAPNSWRQSPGGKNIDTVVGWEPTTPQDWDQIWAAGLAKLSMGLGFDLSSPPSKGGSGSRGPRAPSAQDIRNMFDEDELTEAVNDLWQGWLVEEAPDGRKLAKAYINEIVRTKGQEEIDFQTFVTNKIKKTSRYNLIYQNKPGGVSEQQFLQPYVQSAQRIMGGGQGQETAVADVAAGGAALGASGEAFGQRLNRTSAVQNSQGFIRGLEDRVRGVSNLLRG